MEGFRNNIDSLANTSTLENILIAIIYWLAIIVVVLFVFYVAVKINNRIQKKNLDKMEEMIPRRSVKENNQKGRISR